MRRHAIALVLVAACGGGGDDGDDEADPGFVSATVDWDGEQFTLEADCAIAESGDLREIDGVDFGRTFGVAIVWNSLNAEVGVPYETDALGTVSLHVVRPHPTEPGTIRVSSASEGTAEFTELSDVAGETIAGTFDDLVMTRDEEDDMVMVTMTDGVFDCVVPTRN